MATNSTLEDRLEAVEEAVAELRRNLEIRSPSSNWLDEVIGIFKDESAFDEVILLGRQFRLADRPEDEVSGA